VKVTMKYGTFKSLDSCLADQVCWSSEPHCGQERWLQLW